MGPSLQTGARPPHLVELVAVCLLTFMIVVLAAVAGESAMPPGAWRVAAPWVSHLPMLVIPWAWFKRRVAPCLPPERRQLFRWTRGSTQLFWVMAVLLVSANLLWNRDVVARGWTPTWARESGLSMLSGFLFQGVMVGLSEEMAFRRRDVCGGAGADGRHVVAVRQPWRGGTSRCPSSKSR